MTEFFKKVHSSDGRQESEKEPPVLIRVLKIIGKLLAAALSILLLVYYCVNPNLYSAEEEVSIFLSPRTYEIALLTVVTLILLLLPNVLSEKVNRIITWIWFVLAPFAVYFSLYYVNATRFKIHFFSLNRVAVVLTFAFLYLLQGLLIGLTGSIRFSVVIYAIAIMALGIINRYVVAFRGTAISASDLFSTGTALTVLGNYRYSLDWCMLMGIVFTVLICVFSVKLKKLKLMPHGMRLAFLAVFVLLSGGYFYLCGETSFLEDNDIRSTGFTHQLRYKKYDMLFTTLTTCFYLVVDKPAGYSVEAVDEIAADYIQKEEDADSAETPNLIVIMNESLADYTDIGNNLTLTNDYMPFIHSLTENTIKGTAYSSVFGSNTANTEYEFLTGNSMAFLPTSSVAYHLFVRGNLPSVASDLKSCGYETLAMHPYRGTNYKRDVVYPKLGFDTYYTRDDFENPQLIRKYISDESLFERIIAEFEKNLDSGKPLFSFNVTMQNHGGYYASNQTNMDIDIYALDDNINLTRSIMYINLVKETDKAFQYLVEYFEGREEPVVIIMFGDHQPDLGDDTYEYLLGGDEETLTNEELEEKYKVPFIIWANYDIEEEIIDGTSVNYLYSIAADRLDLPMTPYQEYLLDLSEQIPVLNSVGYWGADGEFYEVQDQDSPYYELINEYNILEYNDIFGGQNRDYAFFAGEDTEQEQTS